MWLICLSVCLSLGMFLCLFTLHHSTLSWVLSLQCLMLPWVKELLLLPLFNCRFVCALTTLDNQQYMYQQVVLYIFLILIRMSAFHPKSSIDPGIYWLLSNSMAFINPLNSPINPEKLISTILKTSVITELYNLTSSSSVFYKCFFIIRYWYTLKLCL